MTLQASGAIAISNINTEIGRAATYTSDLGFLNGLILASQRPGQPNMAAFYSKAYFQNNTHGNCNNGNCTNNCNCGNIQCTNCFINGGVNCANCDTQPWLQTNCNCACTYNCTFATTATYNCDCNCNCGGGG